MGFSVIERGGGVSQLWVPVQRPTKKYDNNNYCRSSASFLFKERRHFPEIVKLLCFSVDTRYAFVPYKMFQTEKFESAYMICKTPTNYSSGPYLQMIWLLKAIWCIRFYLAIKEKRGWIEKYATVVKFLLNKILNDVLFFLIYCFFFYHIK